MYDKWIKAYPQGSLWQSLERRTYQEARGREVRIYVASNNSTSFDASALVFIDKTSMGYTTWDIARGPLWVNKSAAQELLAHIVSDARNAKALSLFFSPQEPLSYPGSANSNRHVYADATRILDLTLSNDDLLSQMHQKGRYNIKVAQKNNIHVKISNDIDSYYELAKKTGGRDQFTIASKEHYRDFLTHMKGSFLLHAYASSESSGSSESSPIAGLIGVIYEHTGIYYYGASDYEHRALMAPYLLQWEAIQHCKKAGCTQYDLLGIAPPDAQSNHPWAGISSFKEKFGGNVITYPAEQQIVLRPMMQTLLKMKRKIVG
jgi:lipid II:glycine glycyltransferase (peptidoglycan interpeptide bridge formation enzyme)